MQIPATVREFAAIRHTPISLTNDNERIGNFDEENNFTGSAAWRIPVIDRRIRS